jgi:hypothetical protein
MKERFGTFIGATLMLFTMLSAVWFIGWVLVSFGAWHAFGPPGIEIVRFAFGVCCLCGLIISLCVVRDTK